MGGVGSGRPPSADSILNKQRSPEPLTPIGTELYLPNYSGVNKAIADGVVSIPSVTIQASGSGIVVYGSSPNYTLEGASTGGLSLGGLSGSIQFWDGENGNILSGSPTAIISGGGIVVGTLPEVYDIAAAGPVKFDRETGGYNFIISNITTNENYGVAKLVAPRGGTSLLSHGITRLSGSTYLSGSMNTNGVILASGSNISILSGSSIVVTGDQSTADQAYVANVLYNTDATPPTASTVPIGSIYVQYAP